VLDRLAVTDVETPVFWNVSLVLEKKRVVIEDHGRSSRNVRC
jgi:hypothetical protein